MSELPPTSDASRLFCVGRNYADHAREMGAERPAEPVLFLKPGSVAVPPGPARLPRGMGRVDFEGEMTLLLSGNPWRPVAGVGLGVDLTLRDRQAGLKEKRLPWDTAKAFDGSALLGGFTALSGRLDDDFRALCFETRINGERRQHGCVSDMLFPPLELVKAVGRFWQLRAGDVIYTGTPAGVGPLQPGDVIEMQWSGGGIETAPFVWTMEAS